jgi:D-ribose pyranose/furanose isomerase RbsD
MKAILFLAMLTLVASADETIIPHRTRPALRSPGANQIPEWQLALAAQVHQLGHRNMILVADAAYPIQTGSGVTVIATGAPHREVVEYALQRIEASRAVRPLVALDKEFRFVPDERAPGAEKLRADILKLLEGKSHEPVREELHEKLLAEDNDRAKDFAVIVFKTEGTIPYSSVFLTLECGYWTAADEAALRQAMEKDQ